MHLVAAAGAPAAPIHIYCADARRLAACLAPESAQLVITSPPYNVGIAYGTHDDNLPDREYQALLAGVFNACAAALAPGGRIAVVAPAGVGRNPWRPLSARIADRLTEAGFTLRGQIVWDKGASGRSSWGSFCLPTNPCLRDTTEIILIAHKARPALAAPPGVFERDSRGRARSPWLNSRLFMELAQDHWRVPAERKARAGHPAPFPVALAERLIRFYGFPGCHVVDPFAGSGTVGIAAARLGCRATLVDIDPAYCETAARRVSLAAAGPRAAGEPRPARKAPPCA